MKTDEELYEETMGNISEKTLEKVDKKLQSIDNMSNKFIKIVEADTTRISDIVKSIYPHNNEETVFELIKALELGVGSDDFLEKVYLYFKEQYKESIEAGFKPTKQ